MGGDVGLLEVSFLHGGWDPKACATGVLMLVACGEGVRLKKEGCTAS